MLERPPPSPILSTGVGKEQYLSNLLRIYYNNDHKKQGFLYLSVSKEKNTTVELKNDADEIYEDLPKHWNYVKDCFTPKAAYPAIRSAMIVVEKYQHFIIAYSFAVCKPVVIARSMNPMFDQIQLGAQFAANIYQVVILSKDLVFVFTDYFGLIDTSDEFFFVRDSLVENRNHLLTPILTDVPFDLDKNNLSKFEKIRDLYVAYSNVGAIIVPLKYYQHLDLTLENIMVIGDIKYCIRGLSHKQYACWQLTSKFKLYSNGTLFAAYDKKKFTVIPPSETNIRYSFNYKKSHLNFVKMRLKEEYREKKPIKVPAWRKLSCLVFDDFISFQLYQNRSRGNRRRRGP